MTQRNPMNDRYQQTGEKKTGKTRKSAASAKPTTKAASSVHIEGKAPKPQGRFARAQRQAQQPKKSSSSQDRDFQPDTPEYRKWRRIWWGFIIAALALTSLSFFDLELELAAALRILRTFVTSITMATMRAA